MGETSAPVNMMLKACEKHSKTVPVHKYLMTKMHHACGQRLSPITRRAREEEAIGKGRRGVGRGGGEGVKKGGGGGGEEGWPTCVILRGGTLM